MIDRGLRLGSGVLWAVMCYRGVLSFACYFGLGNVPIVIRCLIGLAGADRFLFLVCGWVFRGSCVSCDGFGLNEVYGYGWYVWVCLAVF